MPWLYIFEQAWHSIHEECLLLNRVEVPQESEANEPDISIATMYRMKGPRVSPSVNRGIQKGTMPPAHPGLKTSDESAPKDHELRERCPFYVASTRARDELVVTVFGDGSLFLNA